MVDLRMLIVAIILAGACMAGCAPRDEEERVVIAGLLTPEDPARLPPSGQRLQQMPPLPPMNLPGLEPDTGDGVILLQVDRLQVVNDYGRDLPPWHPVRRAPPEADPQLAGLIALKRHLDAVTSQLAVIDRSRVDVAALVPQVLTLQASIQAVVDAIRTPNHSLDAETLGRTRADALWADMPAAAEALQRPVELLPARLGDLPVDAAEYLTVVRARVAELNRVIAERRAPAVTPLCRQIQRDIDLLEAHPAVVRLLGTDPSSRVAERASLEQRESIRSLFGDARVALVRVAGLWTGRLLNLAVIDEEPTAVYQRPARME